MIFNIMNSWRKVPFCLLAIVSLFESIIITYTNAFSVEMKLTVNKENNNGRRSSGSRIEPVHIIISEDYSSSSSERIDANFRGEENKNVDFRQRINMLDEFKFDISKQIPSSEGSKKTVHHHIQTFKRQQQQHEDRSRSSSPNDDNVWVGRPTINHDQETKKDDSVHSGDNENEHSSSNDDNAIGEAILFYDKETRLLVGSITTKKSFYNIVIFAGNVGEATETSYNNFKHEDEALILNEEKIVPFSEESKRRNLLSYDQVAPPIPPSLSPPLLRSRNLQQEQLQEGQDQGNDQDKAVTFVDVIIPYTKRAMCYVATGRDTRECDDNEINRSFIESRARLAVAQANVAMEMAGVPNSLVQQRLVLTYLEPHFDEYGLSGNDVLTRLYETNDGYMDDIHDIRNRYAGDLVSLFTYGTFTGISFVGSSTSPSKIGFSSTNVVSATGYYTYAHETGHGFGLLHDRRNAFGATEDCPDKECCRDYCTSYGYKNPSNLFRSLMTYSEDYNVDTIPRALCYSSNMTTYTHNGRGYSIGDSWNTNAYEILKNYHNIANYRTNTDETLAQQPTLSPKDIMNLPNRPIPKLDEMQAECFSASTTLQVKNKGRILIKNVQVGDQVLAGGGKYEIVYTIDHYSTSKQTNFLQIHTTRSMPEQQFISKEDDMSSPLEVTYQHMMFIHGRLNPIPASGLQIGDYVQSIYGPQRVTKILNIVRNDGYYNPLTTSGTIIANQQGIMASTYSTNYNLLSLPLSKGISHDSISSENSEYYTINIETKLSFLRQKTSNSSIAITIPYQRMFHTLLQPMKYFCVHVNPDLCKLPPPSSNPDHHDEQIVAYTQFGRYILNKIQNNKLCKEILFTIVLIIANLIDIGILSIQYPYDYYFIYCTMLLLASVFIIKINFCILYNRIESKSKK